MSDYGDGNYSDGDYDPWYYIEETYQAADDLAEHAVASPPPIYMDEDQYDDFDLFDFWYDIEEGSDADVEEVEGKPRSKDHSKAGQKRKRGEKALPSRKTRKVKDRKIQALPVRSMSPTPTVLWLSQNDRDAQRAAKAKYLDDTTKPYALLKDWRDLAARSPKGKGRVVKELEQTSEYPAAQSGKGRRASITGPLSPSPGLEDDEMQELISASGIDPEALMTALQNRMADAQGLEGFDRTILLKYAMRMMANEDESEDIAGELTEEILDRDDDDPQAAGIASWISQQMGTTEQDDEASVTLDATDASRQPRTRKRKADADDAEITEPAPEPKRAARGARFYNAPTAASQARSAASDTSTSKATRSGRARRG
ncbi:hypothetical protein BU16DRAFT_466398 [Lophium mytilinum]|uniref:Uncharacterized protein n=1 Tax=Lophium mytilinum TaxID=390894 RepID=A0A6A6QKK3_9PEZI|nr:hypothetical protein BU16DRAFT_466398 [Lophium mytilinum]